MVTTGSEDVILPRALFGRDITTYAIGGPIPYFFEPSSLVELKDLLGELGIVRKTIGAGSNILINDEGIASPVVRLGKGFKEIKSLSDGRFYVGAAVSLMNFSRTTAEEGWSGLEFAGGIPASIGGAIMMNAGAHGGEIVNCLERIEIITEQGEHTWVSPKEFSFGYRHSGIPELCIIIGAEFRLAQSSKEKTSELRRHNLEERKKRQPLTSPSAGSVFKNPPGASSAGAIIEQAGLKGTVEGGAQISELHGNWIINPGRKARAVDVLHLIELCKTTVQDKFNTKLETEVKLW